LQQSKFSVGEVIAGWCVSPLMIPRVDHSFIIIIIIIIITTSNNNHHHHHHFPRYPLFSNSTIPPCYNDTPATSGNN